VQEKLENTNGVIMIRSRKSKKGILQYNG